MRRIYWGLSALVLAGCGEAAQPAPSFSSNTGTAGTAAVPIPSDGNTKGDPEFEAQSPLPGEVVHAERALRPVSGGTLLVLRDQKTALVADPDRDQLFVVDLEGAAVKRTISLPAGAEPGRAAEDASGNVHVALRGTGQLVSLSPASGEILATRPVCAYPRGVAVTEQSVHVACSEGALVTLSTTPTATAPLRSLKLDHDLRDVVADSEGLWVSVFRSAEVLRLDSTGKVQRRVKLPDAQGPLGQSQSSVAWRMVPSATGGVIVVHQRAFTGEVTPSQGGYGASGGPGGIVSTGVTMVSDDGTATGSTVTVLAPLAVDIAQSPTTGLMLLASAAVEHPTNGSVFGRTLLLRPSNLRFTATPDTSSFEFASSESLENIPRGQLVAVGFAGDVPLLQYRDPSSLVVGGRGISLPGDSVLDTGNTLFHLETSSGLACASCHPEGQEDGHVWNFTGFGARRTQTLRGGLLGTEPFHWDGLEQDFSALTSDVMQGRMGGPKLTAEQSTALVGYLDVLPAMPAPSVASTASIERGKQLFNDGTVGCATCHNGSRFSNDQTVDVGGTGGQLQVPGLIGIWSRAPYLHDGCAKTLLDRFTTCDTGKHGLVKQLPQSDLVALTDYLETL
jgi:mono/diheme cytochrome c family protein/streptogramin lyase